MKESKMTGKLVLAPLIFSALALGIKGQECDINGSITSYNDAEYLCCDGRHRLYQNGAKMGCCKTFEGYKLYKRDTELCCGEQSGVNKTYYYNGKEYTRQCCTESGEIVEPHKLETCCGGPGGNWYKVQKNNITDRCCAKESYDPIHERCCENVEKGTYKIYSTPGDQNTRCCSTSMYDIDKMECNKADGSLRLRDGQLQCHGNQHYNPLTHLCCYEGNIVPRPNTTAHARFAIEPDYQCREGIVYDAYRFNIEPSSKKLNITAFTYPKEKRPCGNGSYNPKATRHQEFCCEGTFRNASSGVNVGCCGTELYDKDREYCCGGQFGRKSGRLGCCNEVLYNKTEYDCCQSQLIGKSQVCCMLTSTQQAPIDKLQKNHTDCCVMKDRSFMSYNKWEKQCVKGQITRTQEIVTSLLPVTLAPPVKWPPRMRSQSFNTSVNPCRYCGSRKKPQLSRTCNLKKGHTVLLTNTTLTREGTMLKVEVLRPRAYSGHTMDILIRYHCRCFKIGKRYMIYTKRKLGCRTFVQLGNKSMIMRNSRRSHKLRRKACKVASRLRHKVKGL